MEVLLNGIPLGEVSTSMTINATAPILLCLYAAVGEKQGVPLEQLSGTVQNDILKEYMARGTYIYPPRAVAAADHQPLRVLREAGAAAGTRSPSAATTSARRARRRRRRSPSPWPTASRTSRPR